jgi:hypothetical protein
MNWFNRWFARKTKEAWNHANALGQCVPDYPDRTLSKHTGLDMERSLRFNVLPARGGTIVECQHTDRQKGQSVINTHVIPEGDNIAESIGHIVSMELLQHQ